MKGVGRNPFSVLGVSPSASIEAIKKAFTKLAMEYHPDTRKASSSLSNERFIRIREAYERIRDGTYSGEYKNGSAVRQDANPRTAFSEQEFLEHLYRQTGTRISSAQRRELIQLDSSRIPGATYNGPGWDFARRVAIEQELFMIQRNEYYTEQGCGEKGKTENERVNKNDQNLRRKRRR